MFAALLLISRRDRAVWRDVLGFAPGAQRLA